MSLSDITCQQQPQQQHQQQPISSSSIEQQQDRDYSTNYYNYFNYMSSCEANNANTNITAVTVKNYDHHHHNIDQEEQQQRQQQQQQNQQFDLTRTIHVGITGLLFTGPLSHSWYKVLELLVTARQYHVGILLRMILDAFVFSPIAIGGYVACRIILEVVGEEHVVEEALLVLVEKDGPKYKYKQHAHACYTTTCITNKLQEKWYTTLYASWKFWPLANIMYVIYIYIYIYISHHKYIVHLPLRLFVGVRDLSCMFILLYLVLLLYIHLTHFLSICLLSSTYSTALSCLITPYFCFLNQEILVLYRYHFVYCTIIV